MIKNAFCIFRQILEGRDSITSSLIVGSGGIRDLDNFLTLPKYLSNIAIFVVRDPFFSQKPIPAM